MENKQWRYIPFSRYDPFMKTAFNDVLMQTVSNTKQPTLWISGWDRNCINLGVSQEYEKVIDKGAIIREGVCVTRRQSGGGATFLTKNGEITWALVVPEEYFRLSINDSYKSVCTKIVDELNTIGIRAYFKPINDIMTKNGKLSGATLRKEQDVVYIGGTLLYTAEKDKMNAYLKPEEDSMKKERIEEKHKAITSISQESSMNFDETIELLKNAFLRDKNYEEQFWYKEEYLKAKKSSQLYRNKEWIVHGKK